MSQLLPRGVVTQWMQDVAGDDVAIHKEAIDWVNECAEEFLLHISKKANAIAEESATKENYRLTSDHVLEALECLGMEQYIEEVRALYRAHEREVQEKKQRIASRKATAKSNEATRQELLAEQNALFKQASLNAAREGW